MIIYDVYYSVTVACRVLSDQPIIAQLHITQHPMSATLLVEGEASAFRAIPLHGKITNLTD